LLEKLKKINWLGWAQVALVAVFMFAPFVVSAQTGLSRGFQCDPPTGMRCDGARNINDLIRWVINFLLYIVMGIAVLFLIIGGFLYITSAGNQEQADKGKKTVINAVIGIVIVILSWVIVNAVAGAFSSGGSSFGAP
jgi:hypothetical protein